MNNQLLIFNYEDLQERAKIIFEKLNHSSDLQENFLNDPTGVVTNLLYGESVYPCPADVSAANMMLFSLLSNPKFMSWGKELQERMAAQVQAVSEANDSQNIRRLLDESLQIGDVYQEILDAAVRFDGLKLPAGYENRIIAKDILQIKNMGINAEDNVAVLLLVFVAIVVVVVAPMERKGISREALYNISNLLSDRLIQRAQEGLQ
ncbi:hypothetical protein [Paenibacillus maysiensis]|uniref:hypothetical protein n=1 Tax=Paenibacillus maysiensis TaxID=1155954 RepID=UPI0004710BC3|nr:hypothetical protein [Paenibacillus maysiensis]